MGVVRSQKIAEADGSNGLNEDSQVLMGRENPQPDYTRDSDGCLSFQHFADAFGAKGWNLMTRTPNRDSQRRSGPCNMYRGLSCPMVRYILCVEGRDAKMIRPFVDSPITPIDYLGPVFPATGHSSFQGVGWFRHEIDFNISVMGGVISVHYFFVGTYILHKFHRQKRLAPF